jgi:hypothetical protein
MGSVSTEPVFLKSELQLDAIEFSASLEEKSDALSE